MREVFCIKLMQRGFWVYYREHEKFNLQWISDPYGAKQFDSYAATELFLNSDKTRNWGGFFTIEKLYVKS